MGNAIDMNELEAVSRPLLPIIFVLDTSGSMSGQPISMLNHAMEEVKNILERFASSNSDALLKIGVLQMSSGARWMQPQGLEEFEDFVYSPLKAGGLTDMGAALLELDSKLSRKTFLLSTTGWCKPVIIFMTDGQPTDNWEEPLKNLKANNSWYKNSIKIGFAVGDGADVKVLSEIVGNSEAVIQVDELETFNILLQKVAINSAMIGSKSHVAGETPSSKEIVQSTLEETGQSDNVQTGGDLGVQVTEPEPDSSADNDDSWGDDDWS